MKPTTLEEALSMVPTHWLLTPGVDVWQDGDEFFDIVDLQWDTIAPPQYTQKVNGIAARRPIPQDVRERVAKLMLAIVESGIELQSSSAYPLESWILAGKRGNVARSRGKQQTAKRH